MSTKLILKERHRSFLVSDSEQFNAFNFIRLLRTQEQDNEIQVDLRALITKSQVIVLSKFKTVLELVSSLFCERDIIFTVSHSVNDSSFINRIENETGGESSKQVIMFELSKLPVGNSNVQDPHTVKNIRGAVLLSLVQNLIVLGKVDSKIDLFTEASAITLHESSSFLSNNENAELMWNVLKQWENAHDDEHNRQLNFLLHKCVQKKNALCESVKSALDMLNTNGNHRHLIGICQTNFQLTETMFPDVTQLAVWMIDDQWSNGWKQLIESLLTGTGISLKAFSSLKDVKASIELANFDESAETPHLALVDLRLSADDVVVESYNSKDLSGFDVVDVLLKEWKGLPVMIASASSRLWNLEKAIQRGASAYWRKSDEVDGTDSKKVISTALDIYAQFVDKFERCLSKIKYKNVFELYEILNELCDSPRIKKTPIKRSVAELNEGLASKVTWMLWQRSDEQNLLDSLLLDTMAIFNELEHLLWNKDTGQLLLCPAKNANVGAKGRDSLVINDTLEHLDQENELGGIALKSSYEKCKGIRNKLSVIHGAEANNSIKRASIENIESALLIIYVLMSELSRKAE